ncbi:MAG: acetylxylan esterase [Bacteroidales bacterium]|nr:acetylxylan esterase [Bacteroidales bacterium]
MPNFSRFVPFASILLFLSLFPCQGAGIVSSLRFKLNHPDGQYASSDTVIVSAEPVEDYPAPIEVAIFENGVMTRIEKIGAVTGPRIVFTDVRTGPVAVILEFRPEGTFPERIRMNLDSSDDAIRIGYVINGSAFEPGFQPPKDLKRYWGRQIRRLRAKKMTVKSKPVTVRGDGIECFDVEVSALDTVPVRGYVAKPKNALERSLPIIIQLHAAGVSGDWCKAHAQAAADMARIGAIAFDFNAHGMLNDADDAYYKALEEGPLKNYSYRPITSRKSYYFRGMFLRAIRALDYITKDPAWDGKTIILLGESQGGAQASALSGLDDRVTDVVINVPAMIGNGGYLLGRNDAWPWPMEHNGVDTPTSPRLDEVDTGNLTPRNARKAKKVAPYFDGAMLMRGSKARFLVEIGLVDTTCPPSEVFSGVNGVAGEVKVISSPYRNHWSASIPEPYKDWWKENVEDFRQDYIKNIIKFVRNSETY